MALKTYTPVTPAIRHLISIDRSELYKGAPVKTLTEGLKSSGGRNNHGHITSRHRGGGHKRAYRVIDFRRNKKDMIATVDRLEYDPNRTAFIALVTYEDGEKAYILAPQRLKAGDTVIIRDIGKSAKVITPADKNGNVEVQAGSIKTRVKLANLRLCENAPKKKQVNSTPKLHGESRLNMSASTRLDLRGMTVDECLIELDRFIDMGLRTRALNKGSRTV